MIGVSFQPGADQYGPSQEGRPSAGSGIQEAIKVLSLRLPRVLGAQPAASLPLLTSQGSGGNPRVDSVVNQIMQRYGGQLPQQSGPPTMDGPTFTGDGNSPYQAPWDPPFGRPGGQTPRVIIGDPMAFGDQNLTQGPDGRPGWFPGSGYPAPSPGLFAPLPDDITYGSPEPMPPLPNFDQPIFQSFQSAFGGGRRQEEPIFEPAPHYSDWGMHLL